MNIWWDLIPDEWRSILYQNGWSKVGTRNNQVFKQSNFRVVVEKSDGGEFKIVVMLDQKITLERLHIEPTKTGPFEDIIIRWTKSLSFWYVNHQ